MFGTSRDRGIVIANTTVSFHRATSLEINYDSFAEAARMIAIGTRVSSRAKRGTSHKLIDHTNQTRTYPLRAGGPSPSTRLRMTQRESVRVTVWSGVRELRVL